MPRKPSVTALLGMLAIAGYQNRDKISQILSDARSRIPQDAPRTAAQPRTAQAGSASFIDEMAAMFTGSSAPGTLRSALGDVVESFRGAGRQDVAESWVSTEPNRHVGETDLEEALGRDTVADLSARTGLPREDLLARLKDALPEMMDRFTPDGRIPDDRDLSHRI